MDSLVRLCIPQFVYQNQAPFTVMLIYGMQNRTKLSIFFMKNVFQTIIFGGELIFLSLSNKLIKNTTFLMILH